MCDLHVIRTAVFLTRLNIEKKIVRGLLLLTFFAKQKYRVQH